MYRSLSGTTGAHPVNHATNSVPAPTLTGSWGWHYNDCLKTIPVSPSMSLKQQTHSSTTTIIAPCSPTVTKHPVEAGSAGSGHHSCDLTPANVPDRTLSTKATICSSWGTGINSYTAHHSLLTAHSKATTNTLST